MNQRLPTFVLRPERGPFDMGALVDIVDMAPAAHPPEVEDWVFWPEDATFAGYVSPTRMWEVLEQTSEHDLRAVFGPDLTLDSRRAWVMPGSGQASLGTLRPRGAVRLSVQKRGDAESLRLVLDEEGLDLSVTDARYFRDEYTVPDAAAVRWAQAELRRGTELILGVGLTRPFARTPDDPPRHWLQVNALHFASNPGHRLMP